MARFYDNETKQPVRRYISTSRKGYVVAGGSSLMDARRKPMQVVLGPRQSDQGCGDQSA
jgi:hypothetical protein